MQQTSLPIILFILILLVGCQSKTTVSDDTAPRKIEILFLGHDQQHHNSAAYAPILASALAKDAININYTDDTDVLADEEELAKYDGIILYANHDEISPEQEEGLFNFIESGKGFIPLHCASYCFRNSEEFVELVGAQFKEHGTGVFTTTIVNAEHPITMELDTFSTWDETYVHDKHNDDRELLMVREENGESEPWTWTRTHGDGRVFYTAYGHDERTWNNPGFQKLVKEGILWAVGDRVKGLWETYHQDMPTLEYQAGAGPIPNYEKRDPAPQLQAPLSPEASAKLTQVPPGFSLELFAAEPDVINPISMTWDEKGRLWVIETVDYPNTVREDRTVGDDRIKICEDTDGDGKADKFTIFADQLNIATSLVFVNGGVLVAQAPYFIFLKDDNGDDKADTREIVMEGWGTFDTHAGPSNLLYGFDNKIWGVVGYSGYEGTVGDKTFQFRQSIYRISRDFDDMEKLTNTSNNTWGLGFTEDNDVFASTANNTHSVYLNVADSYLDEVKGIPAGGSMKIDGHYAMHPITMNYRQVDVFGGFTAAAGHHFYTARNYPEKFWNKIAFVCEPTGGLVHSAVIERDGAGFAEKDGWNLFASADEWSSPVEAKVGPDGQVWVADWYNFIVQHNPTPTPERGGFEGENGDGNAHVNPLRDKSHGRIWRVVYKGNPAGEIESVDKNSGDELLTALQSDNQFWRMTAQRLLVERGKEDVVPELLSIIKSNKNKSGLHALWILDGLEIIDRDNVKEAVVAALQNSDPAVRRAAIQILDKNDLLKMDQLDAELANESDPGVQSAIMLALSKQDANGSVGKSLYKVSQRDAVAKDPYLSQAVYVAAGKHQAGFISAFLEDHPNYGENDDEPANLEVTDLDDSSWKEMKLPQFIEQAGVEIDGEVWFRTKLELTAEEAGRGITLLLGAIDDSDETWVNGTRVGATEGDWRKEREYKVSSSLLQAGANTIAIRLEDERGGGGFRADKENFVYQSGDEKKALPETWKYKVTKITRTSGRNLFGESSLAEVLVKSYWDNFDPDAVAATMTGDARKIELGVIKNEMKYDTKEITVKAGEMIEIVFKNDDFMQHNLIIGQAGTLEVIGAAADKLAADPKGSEQNYVPQIPQVLHNTRLVNPNETVTLTFKAPDKPGDYPFVCTFPGHWRIMNGVMKVVAGDAI
ncbi:PVC-type heme-binding CxxCH protein [Flavilitoribacter nigricans]|uniref:Dehydrogenase n=1 Tax=Flavilitoribacter nigricans (strain ATCC 23147 / DSM 23189 / NBRC 102662 / NCIMB 1420 / SS-2) TaxID=1122177 RepID=A0A2D0MZZ5_FLAN2|nr:PVC-type heme-binding CxxCH protein [Flavilitoribacter nigricans]PHN01750.1 dehydrogenase [Flavilitoribacter nigricans DSM 23189 = NBRC 102662]